MIVPLLLVGGWATAIRCISAFVHPSKTYRCMFDILYSNRYPSYSCDQSGPSHGSWFCCCLSFEFPLKYGIREVYILRDRKLSLAKTLRIDIAKDADIGLN